MRRGNLALIVLSICIVISVARAATVFYEKTTCDNGFTGAFIMTSIDQWGGILGIYGVDCDGKRFRFESAEPRPADPGLSYDVSYTGVIDGQTWYARIKRGPRGTVEKAWGQRADGTRYEVVTAP